MSRLWIFALGVLLGAAGVFFLYQSGMATRFGAPDTRAPAVTQGPLPSVPTQPVTPIADSQPASPLPETGAPGPIEVPPLSSSGELSGPPATELTAPTEAGPGISAALPSLLIPVEGVAASQLVDTYTQSRGAGRLHDAIDIMAPRGARVLAVADGRIAKLFTSKPGGLTVYQFDTTETLGYYYAHLDSYAPGLAEGQVLKRGDLVGFVGSTGNADPAAPHLHFAVFLLGPDKKWYQGTYVNPYPLLGKPVATAGIGGG
jgi:murein DD-endopeptidase MepM/ murein hydrolase activator NlpD